ncbi:MAG: sulfite dehydrogenase [Candidatus Velthaea sp.]
MLHVEGSPIEPGAASHRLLERRAFLTGLVGLAGSARFAGLATEAADAAQAGVRPSDAPQIVFSPLARQREIVTPNRDFFVRNHAGVPSLDAAHHRLLIDGLVERPLTFDLADLRRFPALTRTYFIECAGNSGLEWQAASAPSVMRSHGLASCASWTGVPLRLLLAEAGVGADARWVLAEGADGAAYDRSLPLAKLLDDALVVYGQNGVALRPEQGYPMRLLLPGYEGSTNVKWLRRLHIGREPWYTREETAQYAELLPDGRSRTFGFTMDAKSVIVDPAGDVVARRGAREIRGFAWSGRGKIARVDVSTDGGRTWRAATLHPPVLAKAFTRFTHPFAWDGRPTTLASRATDETGYVQPTHARLVAARGYFSEYHNNAIQAWRIASDGRVSDTRA